jgi:hypothetical protein
MIAPEDPPGFVVRTEAQKATWDNGFRLERGVERGGWLATHRPPHAVRSVLPARHRAALGFFRLITRVSRQSLRPCHPR